MSPGSILVVDDSPSKRYVICQWLRRGGYDLVEAETGKEALARLTESPVDLVVLDVRLPDMSGFAVCERIKANPAHASIPVIHVSAAAVEIMDRTQGLTRGADAYLVEPIDPDELLATVHAILRYYRGRQHAERLAARLSTLAVVTVQLSQARSAAQLLAEAVVGAASIFQAPAMVCAEGPDGIWFAATSDGPGSRPVVRPWEPPPGTLIQPIVATDFPTERAVVGNWGTATTLRFVSAQARPDRRPVGVMVPTDVSDPEAPVQTLLAQSLAAAMETMRAYAVEHHVALTLQQSLLPQRLPSVRGIDLAKRYVPASEMAEIGGDFYELSEMDGQLVVAVGDVGGHSLHAATIMAQLRHATRAYVVEGHSPGRVLDQLNGLMRHLLPNEIATMCLVTMDPLTGKLRLANAGHPPPLVVEGDRVTMITDHDALLGLRSPPMSEWDAELAPGATLVLYTDGLVERRGEHIDQGLARLVAAAANPEADLDAYCDRLLREVGPAEPSDDIAVVAVRRTRS